MSSVEPAGPTCDEAAVRPIALADAADYWNRLLSIAGAARGAPPERARAAADSASADRRLTPEEIRDLYEERAAIREFDGGQTREEAEAGALAEMSEPDCVGCHRPLPPGHKSVVCDACRNGPRGNG